VYGTGDTRVFKKAGTADWDGDGTEEDTYTNTEDFGTLYRFSDKSFVYVSPSQWEKWFDKYGHLTEERETHDLARTYTYDGSGRLPSVKTWDQGVPTFDYSNPALPRIREPGNRTVTLSLDGSWDLTAVTDPAAAVRNFTYEGHRLTRDQWSPQVTT